MGVWFGCLYLALCVLIYPFLYVYCVCVCSVCLFFFPILEHFYVFFPDIFHSEERWGLWGPEGFRKICVSMRGLAMGKRGLALRHWAATGGPAKPFQPPTHTLYLFRTDYILGSLGPTEWASDCSSPGVFSSELLSPNQTVGPLGPQIQ